MSRLEGRNVSVESSFLAPTHPAAIDLSGIASAASRGSRRRCLVINNEGVWYFRAGNYGYRSNINFYRLSADKNNGFSFTRIFS